MGEISFVHWWRTELDGICPMQIFHRDSWSWGGNGVEAIDDKALVHCASCSWSGSRARCQTLEIFGVGQEWMIVLYAVRAERLAMSIGLG
jgi:hypothetical protein